MTAGFDDQIDVDGTMGGGWYAMWWPGKVRAANVPAKDTRRVSIGSAAPP